MVEAHFCNSGGGGGGGGKMRTSFANWKLYGLYLLRNVSYAQKENQRTHMKEIFNKIKNYVQGIGSCPLPWSLSIADDQDL